jgi:predicted small lipoprotein YifL
MVATPRRTKCWWLLFGLLGTSVALTGCGQRGALYLPDRNARVVTRPAAASAPADASAPASAPN